MRTEKKSWKKWTCSNMAEADSFSSALVRKLAKAKQSATARGLKPVATTALEQEVARQLAQAGKKSGGNSITGEGVTKSGGDD